MGAIRKLFLPLSLIGCYVLLIELAMTFCFATLGNRILNKKS